VRKDKEKEKNGKWSSTASLSCAHAPLK